MGIENRVRKIFLTRLFLMLANPVTRPVLALVYRSRVCVPTHSGFAEHSRSSARSTQSLPTARDTHCGAPAPCGLRVLLLQGNICLICSWLHLLRYWSLLKTRGDSGLGLTIWHGVQVPVAGRYFPVNVKPANARRSLIKIRTKTNECSWMLLNAFLLPVCAEK